MPDSQLAQHNALANCNSIQNDITVPCSAKHSVPNAIPKALSTSCFVCNKYAATYLDECGSATILGKGNSKSEKTKEKKS